MSYRHSHLFLVLLLITAAAFGQEGQGVKNAPDDQQQDIVEQLKRKNKELRAENRRLKAELLKIRKELSALRPASPVQTKATPELTIFKSIEQILNSAPQNVTPAPRDAWNDVYVERFRSWLNQDIVGKTLQQRVVVTLPPGTLVAHKSSFADRNIEEDSIVLDLCGINRSASTSNIRQPASYEFNVDSKDYGVRLKARFVEFDSPMGKRLLIRVVINSRA